MAHFTVTADIAVHADSAEEAQAEVQHVLDDSLEHSDSSLVGAYIHEAQREERKPDGVCGLCDFEEDA